MRSLRSCHSGSRRVTDMGTPSQTRALGGLLIATLLITVPRLARGECDVTGVISCLVVIETTEEYWSPVDREACIEASTQVIEYCDEQLTDCTDEQTIEIERRKQQTREVICQPDVSAACDFTAAVNCVGTTNLPDNPTLQQCRDVLAVISTTVDCVSDVIAQCDEAEQETAMQAVEAVQTTISQRCGGLAAIQCDDVGFKYPKYEYCLEGVQLEEQVLKVMDEWNRNRLGGDTSHCGALATAQSCWEMQAKNCKLLIDGKLPQLYDNIAHLKQAIEICGSEVEVYPPVTACSEGDKAARRQDVLANCALQADYSSFGVAPVCVAMQNQIDCIQQRANGCPEVADEFIRPRVHSYGMANEKFCGNMTIAGVAIRSIDRDCSYDSLYGCFVNTFLSSFPGGHSTFNKDSFKLILQFYQWDDAQDCRAFRFSNFTHIRLCERSVLFSCQFALPMSPQPYFTPQLDAYESTLYANLDKGPLPINQYGAWYLQYKGNFVCFPACQDYEDLDSSFTPCLGQLITVRDQLATLSETDDSTSLCSELDSSLDCVSGVTRSCPMFLARTEDVLNSDTVAQAVARCNLTVDIYPEEYGTTIPASTLYPPSTSSHRTVFTTSTTLPWSTSTRPSTEPTTNTTEDGYNATKTYVTTTTTTTTRTTTVDVTLGSSSLMVSHVIVAMATIVSVASALSTRW